MGEPYRDVFRPEQDERARPVLRAAMELIRRGWCRGYWAVDGSGGPPPATRPEIAIAWSLDGAIATAGKGEIECEWARRLLRRLIYEHSLPAWNDHPLRTKRQVIALLQRAMKPGAGDHRGGWRVNHQGPVHP